VTAEFDKVSLDAVDENLAAQVIQVHSLFDVGHSSSLLRQVESRPHAQALK